MKSAFDKIAAGVLDAIEMTRKSKTCPKCKGWGIPNIIDYRIEPCPKCGAGKKVAADRTRHRL